MRPEALILAGNAYLGHVVPELENRVMPFSTQIIATEPLGERAAALLPTDVCVEDVRYVLDYYRLSADGRLLFGGGTVYGGTDPADIRAKLVPNLERVFPQLKGVGVDFAWSGNCAISFSRVPQLGRLGGRTYFAQGYSGHGVVGSHLFGRILAEAVDGDRGALRRLREGALDPVSRAAGVRGALFRSRIVVVWLARPPRRCDESGKDANRMKTRLLATAIAGLAALPALAQDKVLHVYNWSDYIAEDTVAKFEEATGHQGRLRRLRFERGAGGEAARRQLGLRRRGADLELPAAADRGRASTCRSTSRSCRTSRTWTRR